MQETIDKIRGLHRERNFLMGQRNRIDLSLGAFLRMHLGWHKDMPDAERKKIAKRAETFAKIGKAIFKAETKADIKQITRELVEGENDPDFCVVHEIIRATLVARSAFDQPELRITKEMEALAKTLPVWNAWAKDVRAFGARSLAVIVGEAGDLSKYPAKGHLWKRMGLAVINGVRQGGLRKTASTDEWIAHGYNAKRRSAMFVIGDCLVKQGERYRQVYLDRKEYERARAAALGLILAPAGKIPKGKAALYISDGHIHRRAQRYMEKRLLKDLWQAWRRAEVRVPEKDRHALPSASPSWREAKVHVPAMVTEAFPPAAPSCRKANRRMPQEQTSSSSPSGIPSWQEDRVYVPEMTSLPIPPASPLGEETTPCAPTVAVIDMSPAIPIAA